MEYVLFVSDQERASGVVALSIQVTLVLRSVVDLWPHKVCRDRPQKWVKHVWANAECWQNKSMN